MVHFQVLLVLLTLVSILFSEFVVEGNYESAVRDLDGYIARANQIIPGLNYAECTRSMHDNSSELRCIYKEEVKPCPEGPPEPRVAWFINCIAKVLVNHGFQVPVYVTHNAANKERYDRITKQLHAAKFQHVQILDDDYIANVTDKDNHFRRIYNRREGGQRLDAEHDLCVDILNSSYHGGLWGWTTSDLCNKHGTDKLTDKDRSLLLINHLVLENIVNATGGNTTVAAVSSLVSNATLPHLQYALWLEDDAFVSVTALRQIAELLVIGPRPAYDDPQGVAAATVDLYWMCDSMCGIPPHNKPAAYLGKTPYVNAYPDQNTKTVVGIMASLPTIRKMWFNGNWIPSYRSIDHWYNYLIWKEQLTVHHTFPPIICHGSHGIEAVVGSGQKRRRGSEFCCEDFYDLVHMHPHMTGMKMLPKGSP